MGRSCFVEGELALSEDRCYRDVDVVSSYCTPPAQPMSPYSGREILVPVIIIFRDPAQNRRSSRNLQHRVLTPRVGRRPRLQVCRSCSEVSISKISIDSCWTHPLHDQLRNTLSHRDLEVGIAEIEQQHLHRTSVIRIDDTRTHVNAVFARQTASWCNPSVRACRYRNADVRVYQHLPSRWNAGLLRRVQIVSRCKR